MKKKALLHLFLLWNRIIQHFTFLSLSFSARRNRLNLLFDSCLNIQYIKYVNVECINMLHMLFFPNIFLSLSCPQKGLSLKRHPAMFFS